MNKLDDKNNCCGCTACENVCPKKAIQMKNDDKGFLYPIIDVEKCVNCGLCEEVCDFKKFQPTNFATKAFVIKHKFEQEVYSSQSGAAFIALCDFILERKGYVCGCVMVDKYTVVHKIESTKDGINKFKGSKYVQSTMNDSFLRCIELLQKGEYVLFSGTGCQVHAFLSLCKVKKINTTKLITCDLICHGCPSIKVWRAFVDEVERRNKKTIYSANFRNKNQFGWRSHVESFLFTDSTTTTIGWRNNFYDHSMFRECCYNCKYTTIYRKTDFTIGDCWGIEKVAPEFDDNKGASLLISRTSKANAVFKEIEKNINFKEIRIENVLQPQLEHPVNKANNYDAFWNLFLNNEKKAIKVYFFPSRIRIFVRRAKNLIIRKFKGN